MISNIYLNFWYCSEDYEGLRELFWEPDWKDNPESTFNGNRHGMNHKVLNIIHNLHSVACYPKHMTHNHQNPGTWQGKLWWTSQGGEVQFLIGPERSGMEICGLAGSKYYIQRYSYNWTIGFIIIQCWKVKWEQIWQYNNMLFIDKTIFVPNWQVIFSPPTRRVPIHERDPIW